MDRWIYDPLSHPEICRMTQSQLADLPFDRQKLDNAETSFSGDCSSEKKGAG